MIANQQEEWISLAWTETDEESAISVSARPDNDLRRKCLSLLFLIFTAAMIIVAQNDQMVQTGYELVKMKAYAAELEKDNQVLLVDIAKLKSVIRIEDIATNELGLVLPTAKKSISIL